MANAQKWPHFAVIHDYAPILCATFTSYMASNDNIKRLNSASMDLYGRRVTLGLGTGLGMKDGVLFPNGEFWLDIMKWDILAFHYHLKPPSEKSNYILNS